MFDILSRNLRFSLRSILKSPLASLTIILSLAVGAGITTAAFSLLNALAFADLPGIQEQDRLTTFGLSTEGSEREGWRHWFSWPEVEVLQGETSLFSQVAASGPARVAVDAGGGPELVDGELVTANYFQTLGAHPALGRFFVSEESISGTGPDSGSDARVAVLSHRFWKTRFAEDPGVLGRTIRVNGQSHMVVGVAEEGFTGMTPEDVVTGAERPMALWVPLADAETLHPEGTGSDPLGLDAAWLRPVARRAHGVSTETVRSALPSLAARFEAAFPNARAGVRLVSGDLIFGAGAGPWRPTLTVLGFMLVPVIVLLVACANAANLLLARNAARSEEISIRKALGASKKALLGQLLTESLILAICAGTLGLLLALFSRKAASLFSLHMSMDVSLDWRVFGFGFGTSLITGVVFGLLPALRFAGATSESALHPDGRRSSGGVRESRLRNGLVVAQVALGLMLLVSSGLLVRSAQYGLQVDSGLDEARLLLLGMDLDLLGDPGPQPEAFYSQLLDRLRKTPGVESAAIANQSPLQGYTRTRVAAAGEAVAYGIPLQAARIGDDYLRSAGIPLRAGRAIKPDDRVGHPRVALLNEAAARKMFPGSRALGQKILVGDEQQPLHVVGIVGDTRASLYREPEPMVYLPRMAGESPRATFYIRTTATPESLAERVRIAVATLAPDLPIKDLETAREFRMRMLAPWRLAYWALGFLGAVAVALAGAGLYGVMAFVVSRRTREIGIRMAMGAEASSVARMVLMSAFKLMGAGLGIGIALSAGVATLLRRELFGVTPLDPWVYVRVAGLLAGITLVATLLPAIRAAMVDPVQAISRE